MVEALNITQEEKKLLLTDLCTRLPYRPKGVKLSALFDPEDIIVIGYTGKFVETYNDEIPIEKVRLYLRPLSSMTGVEVLEYISLKESIVASDDITYSFETHESIDWLNAHHFDYRGLIEKGLAIEVTEENNPYNMN